MATDMLARTRKRKLGMALAALIVAGLLALPPFGLVDALACSMESKAAEPSNECEELSASCCCHDTAPATCDCSISPAPILPNTALTSLSLASSFLAKGETARLLPWRVTPLKTYGTDLRSPPSNAVFAKHCALLC